MVIKQKNIKIRKALKEHDIPQWMLAEHLGVSEFTLIRKMRHELPENEQQKMISIIEELTVTE